MQPDLHKSLVAISICIPDLQGKEGLDVKCMIKDISKAITERIVSKLNPSIDKVEAVAEKMQKLRMPVQTVDK